MKNPRTHPFETYRKQARSLEVSPVLRDKTLEKIRKMENRSTSSVGAANHLPVPRTTPALQAHKRAGFLAAPLKVAACLALIAGIGYTALSPTLLQHDANQRAVADAPLYPSHRIQFDFYTGCDLIEDGKVYHTTPLLLTLPGDLPDSYSVRFEHTGDIFFAPQDAPFNQLPQCNIIEIDDNNEGRLYLEAWYSTDYDIYDPENGNQPPNEPLYRHSPPSGWTMDPAVAIETLERLQNCEISIIAEGQVLATYTIDFAHCHTREEIAERMHAAPGFTVYFLLDQKGKR